MLLLRRPKQNVVLQCLRRYSAAATTTTTTTDPTHSHDPSNAFISCTPDVQLKKFNINNNGHAISTLAVKDNISTLDFPTTCASGILASYRSPYDATVVSLLKQRGAHIVGKTNMDEFGMGSHSANSHFGPVVQRYTGLDGREFTYSAGGSSGGSAVAVRQGLCSGALGTDTGGSVRLPAAWCGVVGFKPSYGVVSRWGVVDYANSFDTVGFFADTVEGVEKLFAATAKPDSQDPTSLSSNTTKRMFSGTKKQEYDDQARKQCTVGVPVEYNIAELSPLVKQAWTDALELCQANGLTIIPISLPSTKTALSAYYVLAPAEASSNLAKYDGVRYGFRAEGSDGENGILFSKTRAEGFGSEVKRRILLGSYSLSADAIDNYFIQAQKVRRLVQTEFNNVFAARHPLLEPATSPVDSNPETASQKVDFILCPTAPTPPPKLDDLESQTPVEAYINDIFTVPASMAGLPAISIPWGPNANAVGEVDPGKNVGLQIIGQFGRDHEVLGFANEFVRMRSTRGSKEPESS